jgi:hypothetical protein
MAGLDTEHYGSQSSIVAPLLATFQINSITAVDG